MNTANTKTAYLDELVSHLLSAKNPEMMASTLKDLLTSSEIEEISKRLQIFKLLKAGMPQRQIAETLGVGIATVTRGSRALKSES